MSENIKKINEFVALFLCTASAIISRIYGER